MCPFTQKPCSEDCKLFQKRNQEKYSGCAINLIADYAVHAIIRDESNKPRFIPDLSNRPI